MVGKTIIKRCEYRFEKCTSNCLSEEYFQDFEDVFNRGELMVYPTETLYALGANPFDQKALERIFEVKRRPSDMPISVAVSDIEMMKNLAHVNELACKIYKHLLPGPVTMLLKKKAEVPSILTANKNKIGIRVPKHPAALKIIDILGPITSTSANLHGRAEPKNLDIAREQLGDEVRLYLDCGECEYQGASTVVDISDSSIKIIRRGVITEKELFAMSA